MEFPISGFGTYKLRTKEAIENALLSVIANNYKMIDTAEHYKNQKLIGEFLCNHPEIDRTKLWITSKASFVSIKKGDTNAIIKGIEKTFEDLQTDYIDLYLIHAPSDKDEVNLFVWNHLRSLQISKKIRHIGVSNMPVDKLTNFMKVIGPEESKYIFCNQIEYNPFLNRKDLIKLCFDNNIHVTAYGSLYKTNEMIEQIARIYSKTPQQILLKWAIQKGIRVIPMAENPEYIKDNISLDFIIDDNYMEKLEEFNEDYSLYRKYL